MGYGTGAGLHRIELTDFDGSANWVDIKASRSYGAAQQQKSAGMKVKMGKGGKDNEIDFDFTAGNIELFRTSIVAWSLKAEETDAEPMQLTPEVFANKLDSGVGEWLAAEIQAWYAARSMSEAELKNSNGRLTAP